MRTPYVAHLFGDRVIEKLKARRGWLNVGVASSIAWPSKDVWVLYDGHEYVLRGAEQVPDQPRRAPCINTPCATQGEFDQALSRVYRFVSILGYFKRGYVDVTTRGWGSGPFLMATRDSHTDVLQGGHKSFSCNHMPIIEDERVRKALAFLREGRRLRHVHEPYSFLSYFKVIESQFASSDRIAWVERNLEELAAMSGKVAHLPWIDRAIKRIAELRAQGINVNDHLYDSGRCAVAHAGISGATIVDPDVPADRKRIAADLDVIEALAGRYIEIDAGVPDEMDLYGTRDRVAPWHSLMTPGAVEILKGGGAVTNVEQLGKLESATVSVRLWPDAPPAQFQSMTLLPAESGGGVVKLIVINERKTILLMFAMDVRGGRMHTMLDQGGLHSGDQATEQDVEDYTRYFHSVLGNGTVELTIEGAEPVDCEVVVPVNIIPQAPEEAVALALDQFRRAKSPGPKAEPESKS